jgi:hypothetical protein
MPALRPCAVCTQLVSREHSEARLLWSSKSGRLIISASMGALHAADASRAQLADRREMTNLWEAAELPGQAVACGQHCCLVLVERHVERGTFALPVAAPPANTFESAQLITEEV